MQAGTAELLDGCAPGAGPWRELLPRTRLGPDAQHAFGVDALRGGRVSHVRVTIFPDGGIMRVRALGAAAAPMPPEERGKNEPEEAPASTGAATPSWPPLVGAT